MVFEFEVMLTRHTPAHSMHWSNFAWQMAQWFMNPGISEIISQIEGALSPYGISSSVHQMGGREFQWNGKEIGHIHWDGDLDILFNRKIKAILMEQRWVVQHKWVPESGWTTFEVNGSADVAHGVALLMLSYWFQNYRKASADEKSSILERVKELSLGEAVAKVF